MCTITYKSPASAPFSPASPSPLILRFVPSSAPAGIFISIFLVFLTMPFPLHSGQGFFMWLPLPWHFLHVVVLANIPKGVLWVILITPVPLQSGQFAISGSFLVPNPLQFSHFSSRGIVIFF